VHDSYEGFIVHAYPASSKTGTRIFLIGRLKGGKTFGETKQRLKELAYDFGDPRLGNELQKLSKGKNAILTRRGKRKSFTYHERYPPDEYFKTTI